MATANSLRWKNTTIFMSLLSLMRPSKQKPVVVHFVSWYPTKENHVEGIFIQRQIELLAADQNFTHIVVRKNEQAVSFFQHLKSMLGYFQEEVVGTMNVISLPHKSDVYKKYFWRHQAEIEQVILNRLVKRFQPDSVHLHVVYGFAKEVLYLKQNKGLRYVVSEHMGPFPFAWLHDKDAEVTQPIKQAEKVVAVSTAQAAQIKSFTGVEATVIPNVVDEHSFQFNAGKTSVKKANGFDLVFVGIYTKAKGVDYLLQVLPDFLHIYPSSILNLVGSASDERMNELKLLIEKAGIADKVCFHGRLSPTALNELHQRCDFYVCSSEWESFGLSALEALFTGLPVVSTNCGGVADFITSSNGLLIDNDQKDDTLLTGLLKMAEHLSSYDRRTIAKGVREKFSSQFIQNSYINIYKEVLTGAAGSSAA